MANLRFADAEALATRIYAVDLAGGSPTPLVSAAQGLVPLAKPLKERQTQVTNLVARRGGRLLESLEVIGKHGRAVKKINYDYVEGRDGPTLSHQRTTLYERPINLGFRGEGIRVGLGGSNYSFRAFPSVHEPGGRTCDVYYQTTGLGTAEVLVPTRIEVCGGTNNGVLRRAQLMDFFPAQMTRESCAEAAAAFCGYSPAHRQYRFLLTRYWGQAPTTVSAADALAVKTLCNQFGEAARAETIGERLRRLNILMELNRLVGNDAELVRVFRMYLSTLKENGFGSMVLVGGYTGVEVPMLWGRTSLATDLLGTWISYVGTAVGFEDVLLFAGPEIRDGNFWATAQLLAAVKAAPNTPPGQVFERDALRYIALHGLEKALKSRSELRDSPAKAQVEWVLSCSTAEQVREMASTCLAEARRALDRVGGLSDRQEALRRQIDTTP